ATGNIGAELVAKAPPDGHAVLFAATSFATNPALTRALAFDPAKSFAPVGLVATSSLTVVVYPQLPAKSMREFIELARRQPARPPAQVVSKLNSEMNLLLKEDETRQILAKQGMTAAGGSPEELAQLVRRELARWSRVVAKAGIKAD